MLVETGQITVSIMFLIIAANIYSRLIALSGMPGVLETWVGTADLGFYALLIIYSIIVNFAIGVTNKLTPQIPVFFIATPFVLLGGFFLLMLTVHEFFGFFTVAFHSWLVGG